MFSATVVSDQAIEIHGKLGKAGEIPEKATERSWSPDYCLLLDPKTNRILMLGKTRYAKVYKMTGHVVKTADLLPKFS